MFIDRLVNTPSEEILNKNERNVNRGLLPVKTTLTFATVL